MLRPYFFMLGVVLMSGTNVFGEDSPEQQSLDREIRTILESDRGPDIFNAAQSFRTKLWLQEGELIEQCRPLFALDKRDKDTESILIGKIVALGYMGTVQSAAFLIRYFDYYPDIRFVELRDARTRDRYPCLDALIQIGKPSSKLALELLPKETDPKRRELLEHLVLQVEGEQAGRLLLKEFVFKQENKLDERAKGTN